MRLLASCIFTGNCVQMFLISDQRVPGLVTKQGGVLEYKMNRYSIHDAIGWRISTSIKVIIEHFFVALTVFQISAQILRL